MLELALYISTFIALSGLMAAVEAAVLNISRAEVEELRFQGAWGADALKAIIDPITRTVAVCHFHQYDQRPGTNPGGSKSDATLR